jgi:hypothetical protein
MHWRSVGGALTLSLLWAAAAVYHAAGQSNVGLPPGQYHYFLATYGGAGVMVAIGSVVVAHAIVAEVRIATRVGIFFGYAAAFIPALVAAVASAPYGRRYGSFFLQFPFAEYAGFYLGFAIVAYAVLAAGAGLGGCIGAAFGALRRLRGAGASSSSREPFRFRWKHARIAALLAALIGVAAHYYDDIELLAERALADTALAGRASPEPQLSAWQERDKALFAELVAKGRYDVVVLPVEAIGMSSADRPARALILRAFADRLERRYGLRSPDPSWIERALGAQARSVDRTAGRALAQATGARRIVAARAAVAESKLSLGVEIEQFDAGQWTKRPELAYEDIAISDEMPPEAAAAALVERVLAEAGLGEAKAAPGPQPQTAAADASLPTDPARLFAEPAKNALDAALRVQFAAMLHPRESIQSEQLWERSLMLLEQAGEEELAALARARGRFHLHRRPFALAALAARSTPQARVVQAVMDGNLQAAERENAQVQSALLQTLGAIEIEELRAAYHVEEGYQARRKAALERIPAYTQLAWLRFSDGDWFSRELSSWVEKPLRTLGALDAEHGAPGGLQEFIALVSGGDPHTLEARALERAYPRALRAKAKPLGALDALALNEIDHIELLFALNRAAAVKTVNAMVNKQAVYESALSQAAALGEEFENYPPLAYLKQAALYHLSERRKTESEQARDLEEAMQLARAVYRWEGGESQYAYYTEWGYRGIDYEPYRDFPPRPWRASEHAKEVSMTRTQYSKDELDLWIGESLSKLKYVQWDFSTLERAHALLRDAGRSEDADRLLKDNQDRFVGSVARSKFLAARLKESSEPAVLIAFYEERIKTEPQVWTHYAELARLLSGQGKYAAAAKAMEAYPGFQDPSANRVALSNHANQAAILLRRYGERELAAPFYQLSAGYDTGSGAEMHSRESLAFFRNDFGLAMQEAQRRLNRYNSLGAAENYLAYLWLTGYSKEAFGEFQRLAPRYAAETQLWHAALQGHRIAAAQDKEIAAWTAAVDLGTDHRTTKALRGNFLFQALTIDRAPAEAALAVLDSADADFTYKMHARGYFALKRSDYPTTIASLAQLNQTLTNISMQQPQRQTNLVLTTIAYAHAKSGKLAELEPILADYRRRVGEGFDWSLAQAALASAATNADAAERWLRRAYGEQPPTAYRPFFSLYMVLEACEIAYEDTRDERFRVLLYDWARREGLRWPLGWAYAFEAKYAPSAEARREPLAFALYLDPRSERIRALPEAEKKQARAWFAKNNPFVMKLPPR